MKNVKSEIDDELRPEYDLKLLRVRKLDVLLFEFLKTKTSANNSPPINQTDKSMSQRK
jgi:hypothetical protein